ncbi:AMP-binding protein [Caldimonas sp. KR1-144]|uniref:AMP-binding protein n=1 Tax=Caldimonas sp. KR1-144 TaxID=3400911 RepID=UPI003C0B4D1A
MTAETSAILLDDATGTWDAERFERAVEIAAQHLREQGATVLATRLDNGAAWVVADAAARRSGVVHLPLPAFFTETQVAHALRTAGAELLWLPPAAASGGRIREFAPGLAMREMRTAAAPCGVAMPAGTRIVTFTSGSTGTPKGVCLGASQLDAVAHGIGEATGALGIRRHLCALPLAVLLEHVAGVLAPLARGATVILRPLEAVGLGGSSSFDPARLDATVRATQPHSLILLPQQLRAWSGWLHAQGLRACPSLKLVAVGGAPVGTANLAAARAMGLPAYEGYGLSEGGSVQTLNLPGADRPGSAGRPLPHARVRIAADGEIELGGALSLGYLGEPADARPWRGTGDLGRLDDDGFLHVTGRKKQVLITAFGRNVSPEWVETALHQQAAIAQAVVFGDGQPRLGAVLWPSSPAIDDAALDAAVARANAQLPDYARIAHWLRGRDAFSPASGFATPNGRPLRSAIAAAHAAALFPAIESGHETFAR